MAPALQIVSKMIEMKGLFEIRVGFGMGFFRDSEIRSRGFAIRIFIIGLIKKSLKSRNPGNRYRDIKTSKKFWKNPESKIPWIPKSRGSESGFENLEKIPKIPGIRDLEFFFESRDFYPRDSNPCDSGFSWVSGFVCPGFGIFLSLGILIPGIRDFS